MFFCPHPHGVIATPIHQSQSIAGDAAHETAIVGPQQVHSAGRHVSPTGRRAREGGIYLYAIAAAVGQRQRPNVPARAQPPAMPPRARVITYGTCTVQ